ncbi:MAG TPA: phosphoribosylaminoimidazolesuccinocarboxamide synthase [Candidatus Kapabacteria bacterium]|nr:phosphoribosylaminoimidazolesuccinocarboxamide synthase [Candidatus Kapabacteria bacterium]
MTTLTQTNFDTLKLFRRGKVRDVYELGDKLLIVASDRISAFDVVMPNPIPYKGEVLTRISKFWFDQTRSICPNHYLTMTTAEYPAECKPFLEDLEGRSMLVQKTEPLPVECIVRGYITGSGWTEYQRSKSVCGISLPDGLRESDKLPEPIFTPSTKAEVGHDENISFEKVVSMLGKKLADALRDHSIAIYKHAAAYAEKKGIIIADTKFEFGLRDGNLILIDEALTPDSSRFWPQDKYEPGKGQPSFDKQFLRDYLLSIKWNKTPPAPELPEEIIERTSEKYRDALRLLTGETIGR